MSLDKSLKSKDALVRHRNVLTRSERLTRLEEDQRWSEGEPVLGLPKVVHRKAVVAKKEKAKTDEETVEGADQAAGTGQEAGQAGQNKAQGSS